MTSVMKMSIRSMRPRSFYDQRDKGKIIPIPKGIWNQAAAGCQRFFRERSLGRNTVPPRLENNITGRRKRQWKKKG